MFDKQLKLDAYSLDEWLENDLRASGILNEPVPLEKKRSNSTTSSIATTTSATGTTTRSRCSSTGSVTNVAARTTAMTTNDEMNSLSSTLLQATTSSPQKRRSESSNVSVTLKRQRNTDAARRSRLRKAHRMESLETKIKNLEMANEQLRLRAAVLESERVATLNKHKRSEERIKELDKQLAEAHEALVRKHQTT